MTEQTHPHVHDPVIVHRTGGKDARFWNVCGICGESIERHGEDEPWVTTAEVDAHIRSELNDPSNA